MQLDAVVLSVTAIVAVLLWQIFQQRMFLELLKLFVHASDRAMSHYLDYQFARSPRAAGTWPLPTAPPAPKYPPDEPPVQGHVADPPAPRAAAGAQQPPHPH